MRRIERDMPNPEDRQRFYDSFNERHNSPSYIENLSKRIQDLEESLSDYNLEFHIQSLMEKPMAANQVTAELIARQTFEHMKKHLRNLKVEYLMKRQGIRVEMNERGMFYFDKEGNPVSYKDYESSSLELD